VNLIEGDAAAMDLGLSGAELRSISGEIDRIHHMAQVS
jgi:thioester reductase-like protein